MAIDRKRIIDSLSKIEVMGNEQGLIPAYGVFINLLPAYFWNTFAERLTRQITPDLLEAAEYLLVSAAHECGYHTGFGILASEEWKAVVAPMVEKPEDVLHGVYAVTAAFGWAKAEIIELTPPDRAVVRAYDYYEADVVELGASSKMSAYMLRGVNAAFMDLVYGEPYPNGLKTFECSQVKGIECGGDYAEFIITRRTRR